MDKPVFQRILLAMLFVWMPLAFFNRAADGVLLTKELIGLVVCVCFGALVSMEGRWVFRLALVQWLLLFTLWMVGDSLFISLVKMEALKGSIHLLLIAGSFLAILFACSRSISYEKLIRFSLSAGFLMAIYGLVQSLGLQGINWNNRFENRAFATLGSPDYLGGYLVGLLPLVFILTLRSKNPKTWLWFRGITMALFAGLMVTRVRGSYLALAGAMLFILASFLFPWGRDLARRNYRYILLVFGILLLGGGAFIARHGGLALFSRSQVSVQQRMETYRVAWEMVKDHPWFGIGLGQLGIQYPLYQHRPFQPADYPQHPYTYSEHVHNEFLQFWVEGGLPGLLLFLSLLTAFAWALYRFWTNPVSKAEDKELLIGVSGSMVALLIQSLSNFPLQVAPTAVLFGLFLAGPLVLANSINGTPHPRPSPEKLSQGRPPVYPQNQSQGERRRKLTTSWVLCFAMAVVLLVGMHTVAASIAYRDTVGETSLNNLQEAVYYGERLVKLSPYNHKAWYAYGKALEGAGKLPEAISAYEKSVETNPNYAEGLAAMGNLQLQTGQLVEAVTNFERVEKLTPNYSGPIWLRAVGLYQLKRYDEAIQEYEKFLVCSPNNFEAYSNLGVCYFQLKRKAEAVSAWKKAYSLNPNDQQVVQYLKAQGVSLK